MVRPIKENTHSRSIPGNALTSVGVCRGVGTCAAVVHTPVWTANSRRHAACMECDTCTLGPTLGKHRDRKRMGAPTYSTTPLPTNGYLGHLKPATNATCRWYMMLYIGKQDARRLPFPPALGDASPFYGDTVQATFARDDPVVNPCTVQSTHTYTQQVLSP